MTVKELKEKLDQITDECLDLEVLIDAGDYNLLELKSIQIGDGYYIVLNIEEEVGGSI